MFWSLLLLPDLFELYGLASILLNFLNLAILRSMQQVFDCFLICMWKCLFNTSGFVVSFFQYRHYAVELEHRHAVQLSYLHYKYFHFL